MAHSQPTESNAAPDPSIFHAVSGTLEAPWEIKRPQRAVVQLNKQGVFEDAEVLDIGCGIGDNAIHIAKNAKGAKVT